MTTFTEEQVKAMLEDAYESGWSNYSPFKSYSNKDAEDCAEVIMSRYQS